MSWFDGKKTYLVAAVALVYLLGSDLGWWPLNENVLGIFGALGLASLRAGVAKNQKPSAPPP